eukprot:1152225-Pelagomonas_calceolata.AAC.2
MRGLLLKRGAVPWSHQCNPADAARFEECFSIHMDPTFAKFRSWTCDLRLYPTPELRSIEAGTHFVALVSRSTLCQAKSQRCAW